MQPEELMLLTRVLDALDDLADMVRYYVIPTATNSFLKESLDRADQLSKEARTQLITSHQ